KQKQKLPKKEKAKNSESMNADSHLEHRASSSQGKHEGESSLGLCDRLDRTRDNSQRQLPTDHDYAVPTREYQTDQSSLKTALTAARSVFGKRKRKSPKQTHRSRPVDTVTPYQANALIEVSLYGSNARARLGVLQQRSTSISERCMITSFIIHYLCCQAGIRSFAPDSDYPLTGLLLRNAPICISRA